MIVVATDYQGLGTRSPSLPGRPERGPGCARRGPGGPQPGGAAASNTVVVLGYSQGGQAALFAGQIAQSYAPELYVAGVAAVAPVTSLTELAPAVPGGHHDPDAGFCRHGPLRLVGDLRDLRAGLGADRRGARHAAVAGPRRAAARWARPTTASPPTSSSGRVEPQPGGQRRRRGQPARARSRSPRRCWWSRAPRTSWSPTHHHLPGDRQAVPRPARPGPVRARSREPATVVRCCRVSRPSCDGSSSASTGNHRPTPAPGRCPGMVERARHGPTRSDRRSQRVGQTD